MPTHTHPQKVNIDLHKFHIAKLSPNFSLARLVLILTPIPLAPTHPPTHPPIHPPDQTSSEMAVLLYLSKGHLSKETIVQGDRCPRDSCPRRLQFKYTLVQVVFCSRKLLPVISLLILCLPSSALTSISTQSKDVISITLQFFNHPPTQPPNQPTAKVKKNSLVHLILNQEFQMNIEMKMKTLGEKSYSSKMFI